MKIVTKEDEQDIENKVLDEFNQVFEERIIELEQHIQELKQQQQDYLDHFKDNLLALDEFGQKVDFLNEILKYSEPGGIPSITSYKDWELDGEDW